MKAMPSEAVQVSVLVVDQQRTLADAIAEWLDAQPDIEIVATVTSAQAARRVLVGRRIDVIVVDGELPEGADSLLQACTSGQSASPRAVVLSVLTDPEPIVAAFRTGAVAWVCKNEPMEHLLDVIRMVARGQAWIPPVLLHRVIWFLLCQREQVNREGDLLSALTVREREVLTLIAHGYGRKQVAERMHLSVNTVRTHMQSLLAKLGVHSALEAVALVEQQLGKSAPFPDDPAGQG